MKLLYSTDIHVHPHHLARLLDAAHHLHPDAVIVAGDLIPDWRGSIEASIQPHRKWVQEVFLKQVEAFRRRLPGVPLFLDLGNDDIAAARPILEENDGNGFHLIDRKVQELGPGLALAGYMWVNPTPFLIKDREKPDCRDHPGLDQAGVRPNGVVTGSGEAVPITLDPRSGTMEDDLDAISDLLEGHAWRSSRFVFVCHAPPRNTALDCIHSGVHVGSLAVRRFIERWSPGGRMVAAFHGHIHESPWRTGRVGQLFGVSPCFNIGQQSVSLRVMLLDTDDPVRSGEVFSVGKTGELSSVPCDMA